MRITSARPGCVKRIIVAFLGLTATVIASSAAERPQNWSYQLLMDGYPGRVLRGEYWEPRIPVALRERQTEARWHAYMDDFFSHCRVTSGPTARYWQGVAVFFSLAEDSRLLEGLSAFIGYARAAGDTVIAFPGDRKFHMVVRAGVPPAGVILIIKCLHLMDNW